MVPSLENDLLLKKQRLKKNGLVFKKKDFNEYASG